MKVHIKNTKYPLTEKVCVRAIWALAGRYGQLTRGQAQVQVRVQVGPRNPDGREMWLVYNHALKNLLWRGLYWVGLVEGRKYNYAALLQDAAALYENRPKIEFKIARIRKRKELVGLIGEEIIDDYRNPKARAVVKLRVHFHPISHSSVDGNAIYVLTDGTDYYELCEGKPRPIELLPASQTIIQAEVASFLGEFRDQAGF